MAASEQQQAQNLLPINELSSYHSRWTIRARVTDKAPLRTFQKSGGGVQGKVFHVTLLDAEGGEIRASFFNEAADKFFDKLEKGKCYTMSKGSLRIANRQFNSCNHRYEISFDKGAEVEDAPDGAHIEAVKFSVVPLRSLRDRPTFSPCTVDVCGVVTEAKPTFAFTSKEGKQLVKREITVADDTAVSMSVTLWGDRAQQDDSAFQGNPVVCMKGVQVKEWNGGLAGSLLERGVLLVGEVECATLPQATKVKEWWAHGGSTQELLALSMTRGADGRRGGPAGKAADLSEMRAAAETPADQMTSQAETYTVHCRLALVQTKKQGEPQPLYYTACQEPREGSSMICNRRVDSSGFCAACNRAGKSAPRLNLRCRFADYGDNCWLTTFHEPAQKVLGLTAEQVQEIEQGDGEGGGREALESAMRAKYFGELLEVTVRSKVDSYKGESRVNVTCVSARPVSRGDRGRAMLREIRDLLA